MPDPAIHFRLEVPVSVPGAEIDALKNALQPHVEVRQVNAEALKLDLLLILEILASLASVIQAIDIIIGWIDRLKKKNLALGKAAIVNAGGDKLELQDVDRDRLVAFLKKA